MCTRRRGERGPFYQCHRGTRSGYHHLHSYRNAIAFCRADIASARRAREPVDNAREPVEVLREPVEVPRASVQVAREPARLPRAPGESPRDPVELPRTPGESTRAPAQVQREPAQVQRAPGELARAPVEEARAPVDHSKQSARRKLPSMAVPAMTWARVPVPREVTPCYVIDHAKLATDARLSSTQHASGTIHLAALAQCCCAVCIACRPSYGVGCV